MDKMSRMEALKSIISKSKAEKEPDADEEMCECGAKLVCADCDKTPDKCDCE